MQTRYSPTEYLYASSRIRARESSLLGKDKLASLLSLKDEQELLAALRAEGLMPKEDTPDVEEALLALLKEGIDTVKRSVPDEALTHVVTYPYDCHNIKAYLKCTYRGVDPTPLFIDAGSVTLPSLVKALEAEELSPLPSHMAAAIPVARQAYAKTGDPREIDLLIDRALFRDLAEAAAGLPLAEQVVAARADLTNLLICLRLVRGKNPQLALPLFARAALPAGTLDAALFEAALPEGEAALFSLLSKSPYARVVKEAQGLSLSEIEKRVDDYVMGLVREARYLPFGAEIPLAYLLGLDASLKNIRILLAGKRAGLDSDTLRQRVRDSYV